MRIRNYRKILTVLMISALSACGGGSQSNDSATSGATQSVSASTIQGTWLSKSCVQSEIPSLWSNIRWDFNGDGTHQRYGNFYYDSTCSGNPVSSNPFSSLFDTNRAYVIEEDLALNDGSTAKYLSFAEGYTAYQINSTGSLCFADGFYTVNSTAHSFHFALKKEVSHFLNLDNCFVKQ